MRRYETRLGDENIGNGNEAVNRSPSNTFCSQTTVLLKVQEQTRCCSNSDWRGCGCCAVVEKMSLHHLHVQLLPSLRVHRQPTIPGRAAPGTCHSLARRPSRRDSLDGRPQPLGQRHPGRASMRRPPWTRPQMPLVALFVFALQLVFTDAVQPRLVSFFATPIRN